LVVNHFAQKGQQKPNQFFSVQKRDCKKALLQKILQKPKARAQECIQTQNWHAYQGGLNSSDPTPTQINRTPKDYSSPH